MNNVRRILLTDISEWLRNNVAALEEVKDMEQEAFDNMPESLQQSDRGQSIESNVSELEDAIDSIESAIDTIENLLQ